MYHGSWARRASAAEEITEGSVSSDIPVLVIFDQDRSGDSVKERVQKALCLLEAALALLLTVTSRATPR